MEEILHHLICGLSHYLHGFIDPRWLGFLNHQRYVSIVPTAQVVDDGSEPPLSEEGVGRVVGLVYSLMVYHLLKWKGKETYTIGMLSFNHNDRYSLITTY